MTDLAPAVGTAVAGLAPVAAISRRDAVVAELKRGVVLGSIQPGEKLTEQSLSAALGVSRGPIREALNQLVMEGLLTQEPYRGMRVADLEPQMVLDIADVRMAMDLQAVEAILGDASGRRMAMVEAAWDEYARHADATDPLEQHDCHIRLHRAIWDASENLFLARLWPVVEAHVTIALAHDQVTRHDPARAFKVHKELIDAMRSGDRDRIKAAFEKHTVDSARVLVELMESRAAAR